MRFLTTTLVSAALLTPIFSAQSYETSVIINEIAWAGTTDDWSYEWIELYNNSGQTIDIAGWRIENGANSNKDLVLSAGTIPPNGYFLVCRKEMVGCDLVETKLSLHNEYNKNGKLALRDGAGNIIDSTPAPEAKDWPGGNNETKQTMEWTGNNPPAGSGQAWQTSQSPNGTPKREGSLAPFTEKLTEPEYVSGPEEPNEGSLAPFTAPEIEYIEYAENIFINEILPSPEGADSENEWIELRNSNNFEVNLTGWQLQDTDGAVRTYIFPTDITINAFNFLVLTRPETKITLQNSGDGLKLLNPNGEIMHTIAYPRAILGQSYNRVSDGEWAWSTILTLGEPNIIPNIEPRPASPPPPPQQQNQYYEAKPHNIGDATTSTDTLFSTNIEKTLPKTSIRVLTFILAVIVAVGSGIVILLIKNQQNKKEI